MPAGLLAQRLRYPLSVAALAAVYVGAAALGLRLAFVHGNVTAVWPPTGIALAALLLFGPRLWPGVALGAFIANAATDVPLAVAGGIAAGNTLEAVVGAVLLRRAGVRPHLDRLRDVVFLVLLAAVVSTAVSATVGVASLAVGAGVTLESAAPLWTTWWLGDAMGVLVAAPLLLTWLVPAPWPNLSWRAREALALLALLVGVSLLLFAEGISPHLADLRYVVFLLVIWAAGRLGPRGATGATFIVSAISILGTVHGTGPFAGGTPNDDLLHLQAFMGVVAVTGLAVVATVAERQRAEDNQRFLARASAALASSLDTETTLQSIARLAVPYLADWCIVDVLEAEQEIRRVAVAAADERKTAALEQLRQQYPPTWDSPQPAARALRSGQSALFAAFSREELAATVRDAAHLALLEQLQPRSAMAVPMVARGHTLGVITFAAAESARRFEAADLALAEEVARRCALAVDNARLYQSERAAREAAEQATRLRDEFLSVASHELRTPVTSLRGYAQLLLRRLSRNEQPDRAKLSRALEIIDQQADRLARLVTQLLDLSRLEGGRLTLDRAEADIAALAQQVVDGARSTTDRHQFVVRADGPVRAEVDPLRLEQVLINLVDNAVRYSPDGGEIEVEIGSNGRESPAVRIAVRDHGVGIAPEHLPYVFDRYYQAHQLGRFGGMGLGLHIAKQIVEQHGGRIEAERPPDGGSRFVVTLPLTE